MQERICPHCHKPVFSSNFEGAWECPNCEEEVSEEETILTTCNDIDLWDCDHRKSCKGCPAEKNGPKID